MSRLCVAVLAATLGLTAQAADKTWTRFESCRYIQDDNNDGDSFLVQCGKDKFYARFYFIDAPETNARGSNAGRVQEQYEYFGVTMEEVTRTGTAAKDFVYRTLSSRPFVLHTKRASAQGRAKTVRYYSLIEVDARYLHEVMVGEGYARTKGASTTLPNGERGKAHIAKLAKLEDQARLARKGIWAKYEASRRKSPF